MLNFDFSKLKSPAYAGLFAAAFYVLLKWFYLKFIAKPTSTVDPDTREIYVKPAAITGFICAIVMNLSTLKNNVILSEPFD